MPKRKKFNYESFTDKEHCSYLRALKREQDRLEDSIRRNNQLKQRLTERQKVYQEGRF